ncbi:hypothetical protein C8J56DRAFT_891836 [Mycena floridula]|nr:hypothetical protein C8J56DRAFT_891836 [Mycena floridula]
MLIRRESGIHADIWLRAEELVQMVRAHPRDPCSPPPTQTTTRAGIEENWKDDLKDDLKDKDKWVCIVGESPQNFHTDMPVTTPDSSLKGDFENRWKQYQVDCKMFNEVFQPIDFAKKLNTVCLAASIRGVREGLPRIIWMYNQLSRELYSSRNFPQSTKGHIRAVNQATGVCGDVMPVMPRLRTPRRWRLGRGGDRCVDVREARE